MLSAAFEGYVEDVFDAAVDLIYDHATVAERNTLKNDTSGNLNNASAFKVNRLFFNLGIPWIMNSPSIQWQKFSNDRVCEELNSLIRTRNEIAHGEDTLARKPTANKWRGMIERLADRLDVVVADGVEERTGNRPW